MKGQSEPSIVEVSPPPGNVSGFHASFARIMTVVIIALVLAEASLICRRWIMVREPTSAVVVTGGPSMDGTQIMVTSRYGNGPWHAALGAENNFETPVLLEPGQYHISITHKQFHLERDFVVERLHMMPIFLPCAVTFEAPFATHDVQLGLENESPPPGEDPHISDVLKFQNNDRGTAGVVYLMPGTYHVTASEQDKIIARQDFYLDRSKPLKVRLGGQE